MVVGIVDTGEGLAGCVGVGMIPMHACPALDAGCVKSHVIHNGKDGVMEVTLL